jgi:hypothetical protein
MESYNLFFKFLPLSFWYLVLLICSY